MKKFNYLLSIDGVIKVVVSEKEKPNVPDSWNEGLKLKHPKIDEWLASVEMFDIADNDKENEDKLIDLSQVNYRNKLGNLDDQYHVDIQSGILLPAENIEIRYNYNFMPVAHFISNTINIEGLREEIVKELLQWNKSNDDRSISEIADAIINRFLPYLKDSELQKENKKQELLINESIEALKDGIYELSRVSGNERTKAQAITNMQKTLKNLTT